MRVRLTRRLAIIIDGVDLSGHGVGDVFEVTRHDGKLLIAEEWAVPVASPRSMTARTKVVAGNWAKRRGEQEQRRIEDRVREELRDSRAMTISKSIG
jgi:hypothetical protein